MKNNILTLGTPIYQNNDIIGWQLEFNFDNLYVMSDTKTK